jgi:hypothetical protein
MMTWSTLPPSAGRSCSDPTFFTLKGPQRLDRLLLTPNPALPVLNPGRRTQPEQHPEANGAPRDKPQEPTLCLPTLSGDRGTDNYPPQIIASPANRDWFSPSPSLGEVLVLALGGRPSPVLPSSHMPRIAHLPAARWHFRRSRRFTQDSAACASEPRRASTTLAEECARGGRQEAHH